MNAIVEHKPPTKSITATMATRYGMETDAFEATVRATCMRPDKDGNVPSKPEFAAFLLVAREYNLNPLTKEIFAFKQKGGGVVPIVSIDGWMHLINSHPAMDGLEVVMNKTDEGTLESATCRIWRKDRSRPVEVTEYFKECIRDTDVWRKWPARMLRHKATIQCARYAFGFSGIYDEDEGDRIVEASVIADGRPAPLVAPPPPDEDGAPNAAERKAKVESREWSVEDLFTRAETWGKNVESLDDIESYRDEFGQYLDHLDEEDRQHLEGIMARYIDRVSA